MVFQAFHITSTIISLAFFVTIILSFYFYIKARNKEKLALIEKGIDISQILPKKEDNKVLKYGILLVGIAVGIFLGFILAFYSPINDVVSYFMMIFFCGGSSLIVYYLVTKKKKEQITNNG